MSFDSLGQTNQNVLGTGNGFKALNFLEPILELSCLKNLASKQTGPGPVQPQKLKIKFSKIK